MKNPVQLTKSIHRVRDSLNRASWRGGFLVILSVVGFTCFALGPQARAVCQEDCLGNQNTVLGEDALFSLTTGFNNTAIGYRALFDTTTGFENTAVGASALNSNDTGADNSAHGAYALYSNVNGSLNTASGANALQANTSGSFNTATGAEALALNTTGFGDTANGWAALYWNTTGGNNTADGSEALYFNTTGSNNVASGFDALFANTTGSNNIALGVSAGSKLTTGSNNIDVGNVGVAGEAKTIRIGKTGTQTNTYIAGIYGVTASRGVGVFIDSAGHLGTTTSSARFKDEIKPMGEASEALLALEPVTFHYKRKLDPEGIPQFGLIAEEVAKVNPDLVARDEQGKPYTVRYEAVNAMLLNEFLKEHRKVEEQEATITELKSADIKHEATIAQLESRVAQKEKDFQAAVGLQQKQITALTATLKEQATQIQKVTRLSRVEVNQPAPRVAVNNR